MGWNVIVLMGVVVGALPSPSTYSKSRARAVNFAPSSAGCSLWLFKIFQMWRKYLLFFFLLRLKRPLRNEMLETARMGLALM